MVTTTVGPQGYVSDLVDPPVHDPTRITRGFRWTFNEVTAPTFSFPQTSLPEGKVKTIETPGSLFAEEFEFYDLTIGSKQKLIIDGPVVMVVENDVGVYGEIEVTDTGSVTFYLGDDFKIDGGKGAVNNSNVASSFIIYGTNTTPRDQKITLGGSGDLKAAVYAPNASLKLNGGGGSGAFYGAAMVYDITFTGTYVFIMTKR